MGLSKKKINELKADAQMIQPKIIVGKNGLNQGTLHSIDEVLNADELAKVKFLNNSIELDETICYQVSSELNAEFIQKIGRTLILYRKNEEI